MGQNRYDGDERRGEDIRREEDRTRFCAEHFVRLQQSDERHVEGKERDSMLCGKMAALKLDHDSDIKRLDDEIGSVNTRVKSLEDHVVGRWFFGIILLITVAAFGVLYQNQNSIAKDLNGIENNQILIIRHLGIEPAKK